MDRMVLGQSAILGGFNQVLYAIDMVRQSIRLQRADFSNLHT